MGKLGKVNIQVGLNVNKADLTALKQSLSTLKIDLNKQGAMNGLTKELSQAGEAAKQLEQILNNAWNNKLGQLDLSKVDTSIKNTYGSVQKLKQSLEQGGANGQRVFNNFATSVLSTNMQLKESSKLLDEMATSFANTVKWGISSSIFNTLTGALQNAWNYSVKLDKSLTDIRIVTEKSADDMERFARQANLAAKNLGASTRDYTEASLIYYQQGLSDEEAAARAEITLKAANVTGQTGQEVSEQLTAVWNGYKVTADEAELYVDKLAAVAASTAADLEELSVGMSKVASAANLMGVDIDQLNATLATVVSVTRQAPESVGTAFKTIYARMGDIEAGLDAETTLGSYTEQMKEIAGVNVLDVNGQLRDMGEVMEEVGNKWTTLSREQQVALSQVMAGTRQYNNLLSLFDSWDMYTAALNESANAAGTLQEQQDKYMESVEAHLQKLSTEAERTYQSLFDKETTNGIIDMFTGIIDHFNDFIEGLGGGTKALTYFGSVFTSIFNKQIANSLLKASNNLKVYYANLVKSEQLKKQLIGNTLSEINKDTEITPDDAAYQEQYQAAEQIFKVRKGLTNEQYQESLEISRQIGLEKRKIEQLKAQEKINADISKELKAMGFKEGQDPSLNTIKNRVAARKEELPVLQDGISALEEIKFLDADIAADPDNRVAVMKEVVQYEQQYKNLLKQLGYDDDIIDDEWQKLVGAIQTGNLDLVNFNTLVAEAKTKEQQVSIELENGNIIIDKRTSNLTEEVAEHEKILNNLKEQNGELVKQGGKNLNLQNNITTVSALIQGTTALTGSLSVFADENAKGAEKANAAWSGATGVISATATAIGGPLAGMVASGVMEIGKSILEITGLWEGFEDLFKSSKEKLAEVNEELNKIKDTERQAKSTFEDNKEAEKYFQENKQRFAELQRLAEQGLLSSSLRTEYETYLDKVQKYNENLVITYDNQGKKIAANTDAMEEGLRVLQEQNELLLRENYNADTWTEMTELYDKQYKTQTDLYNEKTKKANHDYGKGSFNNWTWVKDQKELYSLSPQLAQTQTVTNLDAVWNGAWSHNEALGVSEEDYKLIRNLITGMITDEDFNQLKEMTQKDIETLFETVNYNLGNGQDDFWTLLYEEAMSGNLQYQGGERLEDELNYAYASTLGTIKLDTNFILNHLKYNTDNSATYTAFENTGFEDIDSFLTAYINGLNIGSNDFKTDGVLDYDKVRDKVNEIQSSLTEILVTSPDLVTDLHKIRDVDNIGQVSSDYEKEMRAEINNFLSKLSKDEFESIKDSLPALFGVESVSAHWKDNKAQLGANGGNIVTSGEQAARDVGRKIAAYNVVETSQQEDFASGVENYLQDNLNEVELANLDTEKLASDFNTLLANAIDPNSETGAFKAGQSLETIIQDALAQQEGYLDSQVSLATSKYSEDIENAGLDVDKFKGYTKHLMETADSADELADSLEEDADSAAIVAKSVMRMNKGVETLSENFDEWNSVLENSSESSEEYYEALTGMKDAIADVLDAEADAIDSDFVTDHLDLIEKAAKGNAAAINALRDAYADDILLNITADNSIANTEIQNLKDKLNGLQADMPTLAVGQIDDADFIKSCQDLISDAGMTVEQANQMFSAMGIEPEYEIEEKEVVSRKPITKTVTENDTTEVTYEDGTSVTLPSTRTWSYNDGFIDVPETIQMIAMGANGKTPQIKSLTKKATGSFNNLSSSNKGGKSSGGSKSKPKQKDKFKAESDRYHDVETQITKTSNQLAKLEQQSEKLFGGDLIENLTQQWDLLNQQIANYNEKLRIAQQEQDELKKTLIAQGVTFNADGTVANYNEILAQQAAEVEALINQYNTLSAEEQATWDENKIIENAEQEYDQLEEDLNRYDELVSDFIPGIKDSIQEALDQQIELQIEAFNAEIQIHLDLKEAKKEWNEFKKKIIDGIKEDDILGNARAGLEDYAIYYNQNGLGIIQQRLEHIKELEAEIDEYKNSGNADFYGDHWKQLLEDYKEAADGLMGDMTEVNELTESIYALYVDLMDQAQEAFDEQIESYGTITDLIEHDKNLIALVYGEDSYQDFVQFYEKQHENNLAELDFIKQRTAFWKEQMDAAEEGTEEFNIAKENWTSSILEGQEKLQESIQNIQDDFLNEINIVFDEINNKLTNNKGLEGAAEEWDLINREADMYLDSLNSLYQMQELESKYLDAIDMTDSLSSQQELNSLMEQELQMLKDKDKLTQYDIDRANLRYEITLKQIALQEAQQNKSSMRLRRDSQGNYSYQYVADNDQVSKAQQELTDLYNQLYNLDKDRYRENLGEIYDVWAEFQEQMRAAQEINDPQERLERELYLQDHYGKMINDLTAQNEDIKKYLYESSMSHLFDLYSNNQDIYAIMTDEQRKVVDAFLTDEVDMTGAAYDNLFGLYNANLEGFRTMTDEQKNIWLKDLLPAWTSGYQDMADKLTGPGGFSEIYDDLTQQLHDAADKYQEKLKEIEETSGTSMEAVKSGYNEAIPVVQSYLTENDKLVQSYKDQFTELNKILTSLGSLKTAYADIETKAKDALTAIQDFYAEELKQEAERTKKEKEKLEEKINDKKEEEGTGGGNPPTPQPPTPTPVDPSKDGILNIGDTVTFASGKYYANSYGGGTSGSKNRGGKVKVTIINSNPYGYHIATTSGGALGWVKKSQLTGYASGGYTGDWAGEDGRLAMLHKKELVLNRVDTINLLNAVEIIRDITSNLGQSMLSKLGAITAGNIAQANGAGDILEQNVHIDAQFPNVTNSKEIENAINNLMNVATQRIGRR